jgi:hypothetical protein
MKVVEMPFEGLIGLAARESECLVVNRVESEVDELLIKQSVLEGSE